MNVQTASHPIRVVLAEQNEIFRLGLEKLFTLRERMRVVGVADSLNTLEGVLRDQEADVVLVDETLLPADDSRSLHLLGESAGKAGIIIETHSLEQDRTLALLRAGARGVIPRGIAVPNLLKCVRTVASGNLWIDGQSSRWIINELRSSEARGPQLPARNLTERELSVVVLVHQGLKNRQIADKLGTTEQVIKNYLRRIYGKLGVEDRVGLVLYCTAGGVRPPAAASVQN